MKVAPTVVVTDAMVERALSAFYGEPPGSAKWVATDWNTNDMRAALTAALSKGDKE